MKNNLVGYIIAVGLLLITVSYTGCNRPAGSPFEAKETVARRVLKSGKIRCSYTTYAPYCIKDPNSGTLSGIFVEAMEEIGRKLGLKVEWVEEVGYGSVFEGLQSDRADVHGSGLWRNSTRGKSGFFSTPLFFNVLRVWIRNGETRLTNLASINQPAIRIAVQDGAIEDAIAKTDFPNAKSISIPQLNPWPDNLLNIISDKADVTFAEPAVIVPFLKNNPGTLKEISLDRPIRVFASAFAFKMGETELQSMIDSAIGEMLNDGTMEKILQKYETSPGEYLRVAPQYDLSGR